MREKFSQAMDRMKESAGKVKEKVPDRVRKKADNKLGLFVHKYIATLFYFDDDIQEVYYEMEEAMKKGNRKEVFQSSEEMKSLIMMKTDPNSAYYSRRMEKQLKKVAKKMESKADEIEKWAEKGSKRSLGNLVREGWLGKGEDLEDLDENDFDLPDLEEGELER